MAENKKERSRRTQSGEGALWPGGREELGSARSLRDKIRGAGVEGTAGRRPAQTNLCANAWRLT